MMMEPTATAIVAERDRAIPQVTIYTGDDCHWCTRAKQYLAQRGVSYIERNVEADEAAAADAIRLSGRRGVPVIAIGERVIVGFQRRELDAALNLSAPDAATEATLPPAQDTLAAAAAAARIAWTPAQEALAARFRSQVDAPALCDYLGRELEYSPANCDHTFRHVAAFLAAHPPTGGDAAGPIALLRSLGVQCDCGYAINICMR
jgi:glutaredoxin-like YruB-family protein